MHTDEPCLTYRGACPEGTRVSDRGWVAEGQCSKGQRHHGAAEQQLQQAQREQRSPGQQQPRATAGDPGRGGQATGSISIRRLCELRSPGNRTTRPRQHHWERHLRLDRQDEKQRISRSSNLQGSFHRVKGGSSLDSVELLGIHTMIVSSFK